MQASAILHTATGPHPLALRVANTFWTRLRGLMLAPPLPAGKGLFIPRCTSVHGSFLRCPIDVIYLDRHGIVTRCTRLAPWSLSLANGQRPCGAAHTLELAAGAIEAWSIAAGDRLQYGSLIGAGARPCRTRTERGSAMIEFTVVAPLITLIGLGLVQYGMLFFARSQINHASFLAAREGVTANAKLNNIYAAYLRGLIPLYGGGKTTEELAAALTRAAGDIGENGSGNAQIELLNPTRQSFDDWNEPALQALLKTGNRRVIPNSGLAYKELKVGAASGQTIQDANLLKLRITHGYLPKIPLVKNLYTTYLTWLDPHTDAFHTKLVADGRIPVVTSVTLHMQSDAVESEAPMSSPGPGNSGTPANPGDPPLSNDPPPNCGNYGCSYPAPPATPPCNPATDPSNCQPAPCSMMCCIPTGGMP
ncbi:DUF192 domain-containing protein [Oxalobacteraceae bacterium A2-2]